MKSERKNLPYKITPFKHTVLMILIAFSLILIFMVITWNTSDLKYVMGMSTKEYAKDVSVQLANDISARIAGRKSELRVLADSIAELGNKETEFINNEFLVKKINNISMDSIYFINKNEFDSYNKMSDDIKFSDSLKGSLNGEENVDCISGQNILFTVPVYSDDEIIGALAGISRKEKIQALIQPKSFGGNGLTCISDTNGNVIISPTDLKPFLSLDYIFKSSDDTDEKKSVLLMKENMANCIDGVFNFTSVDGRNLILSYNSIENSDWVLLTLIPADLLSSITDGYVIRTFIIIILIIFLFIMFLIVVFRFYKNSRKQLVQAAFFDSITEGINNAAFQLKCRELICKNPPLSYTIVILNIKGFKLINENFGLTEGNKTLRYVYDIIKKHLKADETATRGEADHFYICMKESNKEVIKFRIQKISDNINSFNKNRSNPYYIKLKAGACIANDQNLNIAILQDRAKTAFQSQEPFNETCTFYDTELTTLLQREKDLNDLFLPSLKNHDFKLFLQPKIQMKDGSVYGAEALVRWINPQMGTILPSDFIPLFERNGKITDLDIYIFEEVCSYLRNRINEGKKVFPISVNISRQHFKKTNFLVKFTRIAKEYGISPKLLEFELTESVFFDSEQIDIVRESIKKIHEMGFLCSLDDFGSGFSSLGLLKEFDVDTIKLDRQFFTDISSQKARDVIRCIISLTKKLGVLTVAEGIETNEQLDFLHGEDCDIIQGYIYSRPLPVTEFDIWLENLGE